MVISEKLTNFDPFLREVCKDLTIKVVPLDKLDPSVSEFERHYKKVSRAVSD